MFHRFFLYLNIKLEVNKLEFKTYTTNDPNNVINKTLNHVKDYAINLKNPEEVLTPSITVTSKVDISANYAYIPEFKRYYFIRDITRVNRDLVRLKLEIDVLETYKADILASGGNVARHKTANKYYDGGDYLTENRKEHTKHFSDVTPEFEETVLMTVLGG